MKKKEVVKTAMARKVSSLEIKKMTRNRDKHLYERRGCAVRTAIVTKTFLKDEAV